jgi:putative tricarboxylic transport membrane protein
MLISGGSMTIFYANGLVGSIVTLALILLSWPLISRVLGLLRKRPVEPKEA